MPPSCFLKDSDHYVFMSGAFLTNVGSIEERTERKWHTSICVREIEVVLERRSVGEDSSRTDSSSKQTVANSISTSVN